MRKVITTDLFATMRIIKLAGIEDRLKPILKQYAGAVSSEDDAEKVENVQQNMGIDLLVALGEGMSRKETENEIYSLVASIMEKSVEDIKKLAPNEFVDAIKQIINDDGWRDFFTSLARSIITK